MIHHLWFFRSTIPLAGDGESNDVVTCNGDGLNDNLVFSDLIDDADLYPNNSLVIVNRWGQKVYEAQPYSNDWCGESQSGDELPQGTYYYILHLNITEGLIKVGNVTIVRSE